MRAFRVALRKAGGQYLLGSFSYADILLAILVQALCPPDQPRKCAPLSWSPIYCPPRHQIWICKPRCDDEHACELHAPALQ